jgi:hypothetical protein
MKKFLLFVKLLLLINALFLGPTSQAEPKCQIDIRVNDSWAVIAVDDKAIALGRAFVNCKETPQQVTIIAANKKFFTRAIPAASDFDPKNSYWNVRLLESSPQAMTEALRSPTGLPEDFIAIMQQQNKKEAIAKHYSIVPRRPAAIIEDPTRRLKGIYVQVRALPGTNKDKEIAAENVNHMTDKLTGTKLTMCPAFVSQTSKTWTKILVGPVQNLSEATSLAKNYGYGSFVIRDPLCPVTAKDSFRM